MWVKLEGIYSENPHPGLCSQFSAGELAWYTPEYQENDYFWTIYMLYSSHRYVSILYYFQIAASMVAYWICCAGREAFWQRGNPAGDERLDASSINPIVCTDNVIELNIYKCTIN